MIIIRQYSNFAAADGLSFAQLVTSALIEPMDINIDNIRQLPIAQQLALVEQIWDGIHDSTDLVQDWHKEEVQRRSQELEDDP